MPRDLARGDVAEIIPLAARQDRLQHLLRLGGREDELHMLRGFFEGLEQRVEGLLTEHVHFVDDAGR